MKSMLGPFLLGGFFFIFSNFFPTPQGCDSIFDHGEVYQRLFNTVDQNPLGWTESHHWEARRQLINILESHEYSPYQYNKELEIGSPDLDLGAFFGFPNFQHHFPSLNDNFLPEADIIFALKSLRRLSLEDFFEEESSFALFDNWIKRGIIPILVIDSSEYHSLPLETLRKISNEDEDDLSEFIEPIIRLYFYYIQNHLSLVEDYFQYSLSYADRRFQIYIHKDIPQRTHPKNGPNYYLEEKFLSD